MTEQQTLFKIENKPVINSNRDLEYERYTNDYCLKTILEEEYLWDMRCWFKPRNEYTKDEVKRTVLKWVRDKKTGKWTSNCGHCVFCMERLLDNSWATIDEIVDVVMRNYRVKYPDKIGTWFR